VGHTTASGTFARLFTECFSFFDRSTFALSVLCQSIRGLEGIHLPALQSAFTSRSTLWDKKTAKESEKETTTPKRPLFFVVSHTITPHRLFHTPSSGTKSEWVGEKRREERDDRNRLLPPIYTFPPPVPLWLRSHTPKDHSTFCTGQSPFRDQCVWLPPLFWFVLCTLISPLFSR